MGGETGCVQEFGGAGPAWVVMSQASVLAWFGSRPLASSSEEGRSKVGQGGRELGWEGLGVWGRLQRPAVSAARGGWGCLRCPEPVPDAQPRAQDLGKGGGSGLSEPTRQLMGSRQQNWVCNSPSCGPDHSNPTLDLDLFLQACLPGTGAFGV